MGDYLHDAVPVGLADAADVDTVARALVRELLALPDVRRSGVALVEGGGRRLWFLPASATGAENRESDQESVHESMQWCHIDAYDDVPLTGVVRTGIVVCGELDSFGGRYAGLIARQRDDGIRALAAVPLPGVTTPIGGLLLFYDRPQAFDAGQLAALTALARHGADAVRRVRARDVSAPAGSTGPEAVGSAHTASLTLGDDPRAAGTARAFLRRTLADWGVGDDPIDTAELCLSELVTNAVIHADATSEVTVTLDEPLLTVAVRDHGGAGAPPAQVVEDEDPLRVFGRGLVLVEALSDSWGSERDVVGTTSWFVLELPDGARSEAS